MKIEIEINENKLLQAIAAQLTEKWEKKINDIIQNKIESILKKIINEKFHFLIQDYLNKFSSDKENEIPLIIGEISNKKNLKQQIIDSIAFFKSH